MIGLEADILLEPVRRDSGPGIAAGAAFAQARNVERDGRHDLRPRRLASVEEQAEGPRQLFAAVVLQSPDRLGERSKGVPYAPQNVLATLYHVLGIDPGMTFLDYNGRPQYLLEDRDKIAELV